MWKKWFQENCRQGKWSPSPDSNGNPKPNPDPDRGAIFLGSNFPDTGKNVSSLLLLDLSQNLKLIKLFCKKRLYKKSEKSPNFIELQQTQSSLDTRENC